MASGGYASMAHRMAMQSAGALPGTAITQTYATAAASHPAATTSAPAALTLTATAIAAKTAADLLTDSDVASLAAMKVTNDQLAKDLGTKINALRTDHIALIADVLALKKLVNQIVDDLQAYGVES